MNDLDDLIRCGYINKIKHPEKDIFILNYTHKTQFEGLWNETTKKCRGLIVDVNGEPKSRCFEKFFNYKEVEKEVNFLIQKKEKFTIFEKYDGSLGISYFIGGQPYIATRGSFTSEQSTRANKILKSKYSHLKLDPSLTYLFEIIYPENRIVLNYEGMEDLVLLSVIETKSNKELFLEDNFGFKVCKKYNFSSIDDLLNAEKDNFEGYVVRFDNGFRFKVKLSEYVRLHNLIFGLSTKNIWESLRDKKSLDLEGIPDEIFSWIKKVKEKMIDEYSSLEYECKSIFSKINNSNRKYFASHALLYEEYAPILFKIYDNKSYEKIIWEKIKPEFSTFKETQDE